MKSVMVAGLPNEETQPYEIFWECEAPPEGKTFVVVRQTWTGNYSERHIQEIEVLK